MALRNLCTTQCVALGVGLRAPTREGTPKHATGTCACPSQLRASEVRLRGALACKAPSPRPPAPRSLVQTFPSAVPTPDLQYGSGRPSQPVGTALGCRRC